MQTCVRPFNNCPYLGKPWKPWIASDSDMLISQFITQYYLLIYYYLLSITSLKYYLLSLCMALLSRLLEELMALQKKTQPPAGGVFAAL